MIELAAGGYRAVVSPVGASLVSLTHEGRDLARHDPAGPLRPLYRGAVLAPWPNRIRDGRYAFGGTEHRLPVNDHDHGCALHGLVLWTTWTTVEVSATAVTLLAAVAPQPGYPWSLDLIAEYELDETGLRQRVTAHNTGAATAPYGVSIHPYLVAGDGDVDGWVLDLPAATVQDVDPDRLLPVGLRSVEDAGLDFRGGARVGPRAIDHAFGAVAFDDRTGHARAELRADDGGGVAMTWDRSCPWVQIHTTDLPGDALHRSALALEPMTCPPDAFNAGTDVVALRPGERHAAWWLLQAIARPR